jgi:hypothetical protein
MMICVVVILAQQHDLRFRSAGKEFSGADLRAAGHRPFGYWCAASLGISRGRKICHDEAERAAAGGSNRAKKISHPKL